MKTLLALAALTTSFTLATPKADACGGYVPELQIFRVSQHYLHGGGGRAFALVAPQDARDLALSPIDTRTYDNTRASAPTTLPARRDLTLVGETGTARTSSRSWLVVDDMLVGNGRPMSAFEIPFDRTERFTLAVLGTHTGLAWKPFAPAEATEADRAFLEDNHQLAAGESPATFARYALPDGSIGYARYDVAAGAYVTAVRWTDGQFYGTRAGIPFGVLAIDGETRVVFDNHGDLTSQVVY